MKKGGLRFMDAANENSIKEKLGLLLHENCTRDEARKLKSMILDSNVTKDEFIAMQNRISLIRKTCYGSYPVDNKFCPKCGAPLYPEIDLNLDYIYVCGDCKSHFHENEVKTELPMKEFRFRYAMETIIKAKSLRDAEEVFENLNLKDCDTEFVELENIERL